MGSAFSVEDFRKNFPILERPLKSGKELIYFDNSATTQKPQCVIDAVVDFYTNYNANVHRGMYELSERATNKYEETRQLIANYFGVKNPNEIVFVRGATEAINLVAYSYCRKFLNAGDEILLGAAEHHANYLPWQVLEQEIGIKRKIIPLDANGDLDINKYRDLFTKNTKLVAVQHISNVLGSVNDIKLLTKIAHEHGAKILIDGACSLAAEPLEIDKIGCDFFACSGHKGFAPTGSGFLFGKYDILKSMPPYHTGGNIVNKVKFENTSFKLPPSKFEAGTQDIAAIVGLGAAIKFLNKINWEAASSYLDDLTKYTDKKLRAIPNIIMYGTPKNKTCVFSFNITGLHPHDLATFLGAEGIAIRAGTHCVQPLMNTFGVPGTARISMCIYNTKKEVDKTISAISKCQNFCN